MIVGVDLDDTLRNTLKQVLKVGILNGGCKYLIREYFESDNFKSFYKSFYKKYEEEIFAQAPAFRYANYINEVSTLHNVKIVTAEPKELKNITIDWLDRQGIYANEIIFTSDKSTVKMHLLIDDDPRNFKTLDDSIIKVLYNQPYNVLYHNADCRIKNMKQFEEVIMPRIGRDPIFNNYVFNNKEFYNKNGTF